MTQETIEAILLKKPSAKFDFPFGEDVMVFRIANKMFALLSLNDTPLRLNLKCEPNNAVALRDIYESVIPGYHMNKKHWNTVILDDSIPLENLQDMIDESYDLIFSKLTKKEKAQIALC